VVGGTARQRRIVDAEVGDDTVRPAEDAVERKHRAPGRKARRSGVGSEHRFQPFERRVGPPRPPLVEVAAQQRRHALPCFEALAQPFHLKTPRPAEQAEMGGNDPERPSADIELSEDRSARLGMRQVQAFGTDDGAASEEQGVAVPAVAHRPGGDRNQMQSGLPLEGGKAQPALAVAKAAIGFLKRDDVGIDLGDHRDGALRIVGAVVADALVNVVARHADQLVTVARGCRPHRVRRARAADQSPEGAEKAKKRGILPGCAHEAWCPMSRPARGRRPCPCDNRGAPGREGHRRRSGPTPLCRSCWNRGRLATVVLRPSPQGAILCEVIMTCSSISRLFSRFASMVSDLSGRPATFALAVALVIAWAISGPLFDYSEGWQLVINTSTTIVTFLMVFIVQNSQNRDGKALQAKIDELILTSTAQNKFVGIEKLEEEEIREVSQRLAEKAEQLEDIADETAESEHGA